MVDWEEITTGRDKRETLEYASDLGKRLDLWLVSYCHVCEDYHGAYRSPRQNVYHAT